jgi:hypothetical protein
VNDVETCGFERRKAVWGPNVTEAELRTSIHRCKCRDCRLAVRAKALGTRTADPTLDVAVAARRKIL